MILARTRWQRARRKRRRLPPATAQLLDERLGYAGCLPGPHREELTGMLQVLLGELAFEAGAGLDAVDDGMRVSIAAQAALLILHRPLEDLPTLRTAIVYPGAYRARERLWTDEGAQIEAVEERHGEAWSHGVMLFSWQDVAYDLEHFGDGENVVFHEVAHALDDQTGASDGMPLLPDRVTEDRWRNAFGAAYERLASDARRRRPTLLDPYGAEDPAEFFAVATESFMETPADFRTAYPDLYDLLSAFYHLDPATWDGCLRAGEADASA